MDGQIDNLAEAQSQALRGADFTGLPSAPPKQTGESLSPPPHLGGAQAPELSAASSRVGCVTTRVPPPAPARSPRSQSPPPPFSTWRKFLLCPASPTPCHPLSEHIFMVIRQQINLLLQQDFPTGSHFTGGGKGKQIQSTGAAPPSQDPPRPLPPRLHSPDTLEQVSPYPLL